MKRAFEGDSEAIAGLLRQVRVLAHRRHQAEPTTQLAHHFIALVYAIDEAAELISQELDALESAGFPPALH